MIGSPPVAITIGNFDGVHLGHAALVAAARGILDGPGRRGRVVALTFDPHPAAILRPADAPARLTLPADRAAFLRAAGADDVRLLTPDRELLGLSPEAFVEAIVREHRPSALVEGPDFRFGRERAGTVETLRRLGARHGFETVVVEPVEVALGDGGWVVASSSIIRWLISQGRVEDARRCLGRPYELVGEVIPGEQRGRTIGYPTANLDHGDLLLPGDGVYAGVATLPDGATRPAAVSVGTKPTFGAVDRLCEVHLVDCDLPVGDYGWTLRVTFERRLREQMAFATLESLLRQMDRDVAEVRRLCASADPAPGASRDAAPRGPALRTELVR
ncbi:MAG TPA: riboflavin biosynthesis protein RibF [Phycisphaerales bacterium]|nr:riboflavin biosynthesis protein RibF [Phycisphaerales bacterium]HMP36469.1 riboflavin biosynthesis protein RibF [Phycisphaerales bacterium]